MVWAIAGAANRVNAANKIFENLDMRSSAAAERNESCAFEGPRKGRFGWVRKTNVKMVSFPAHNGRGLAPECQEPREKPRPAAQRDDGRPGILSQTLPPRCSKRAILKTSRRRRGSVLNRVPPFISSSNRRRGGKRNVLLREVPGKDRP